MYRNDVAAKIAEKTKLTPAQADKVLVALIETVKDAIAAGDRVQLVGFGTFEARNRAARIAHDPRTGEEIKIPARRVPAFKPGKALKEAVNK